MTLTLDAYNRFQVAYDTFNAALFGAALPPCLITLQRRDRRSYGYYSPKRFRGVADDDRVTDEIALNPLLFKSEGPLEALQTLAHEMCHLWQQHFGTPSRAGYHNEQWAAQMESIGLMPSSTGKPGGARVGQKMADYVIAGGPFERIARQMLDGGWSTDWYDALQEQRGSGHFITVGPDPGPVTAPTATAKRKVKYTCQRCMLNVWAKPAVRVICGEHGVWMIATITV